MSDRENQTATGTEPPGEGDSLEDAAREAAEEMEKADAPYAGRGDGG
ncbi:hypothetical protein [Sphingomonas parva]|nr:hypothetical protein [Sphingomonas parva]